MNTGDHNTGDLILFYSVLAFCIAIAFGLIAVRPRHNYLVRDHGQTAVPIKPAPPADAAGAGR